MSRKAKVGKVRRDANWIGRASGGAFGGVAGVKRYDEAGLWKGVGRRAERPKRGIPASAQLGEEAVERRDERQAGKH